VPATLTSPTFTTILPEPVWREKRRAHEQRVDCWIEAHRTRAARGEKHPVYDFLFTYYSFRPAWLRRWHPGPGVALAGEAAREFLRWPEYRSVSAETANSTVVAIDTAAIPSRRDEFVAWLRRLLIGMQARPAFFGCFGLHEWAMVYRQSPGDIRHQAWPLRFPPEEIARIVEASGVCCSHFDAFRFFTAHALPLNRLQPTRGDAAQLEQRGCLHANMDLYKWSFKLAPFSPSELIADCFELARDIREIDMRASPYDLSGLGFPPIAIETASGRAEYEKHQRAFAARGEPLRAQLIALCDQIVGGRAGL
jgi:hypothetical protein